MGTFYYTMSDEDFKALVDSPTDGIFYGCIYYQSLCFDMVVRKYQPDSFDPGFATKDNLVLDLDCYILGIDDGYGYLDDDTPYSFYEYCGTSAKIPESESKNAFLKRCIQEIKSFISTNSYLEECVEFKENKWINHTKMEVIKYEEF